MVVGNARDGAAGNVTRAFRWTTGGGTVSLGTLNGGSSSDAFDVNTDGTVIIGTAMMGSTSRSELIIRLAGWM